MIFRCPNHGDLDHTQVEYNYCSATTYVYDLVAAEDGIVAVRLDGTVDGDIIEEYFDCKQCGLHCDVSEVYEIEYD